MAFDQNLVPNDLRPLNIVRTMPEDPRIVPVTSSGRPVEGFYASPTYDTSSPNSVPAVYYPVSMPERGFVGPGNVAMRMPAPVLVPATVSGVAGWAPYVPPPQSHGVFAAPGFNQNHNVTPQVGGIASDQASEESDDSVSGRKVKFLCSFGGRILPRPSDGALRYVGGQTRIISVRRDVSFAEFVKRMVDIYGQNVAIKYQLPEEDLDALVSISCPDDLDNMMDEYEKLLETSTDGSAKLRVFLFSPSEVASASLVHFEAWHDSGQKYVDVVNGFTDDMCRVGTPRKESTLSAAFNRGSDANMAEVIDNLAHVQLEVTVPTSTGVPSPRENSTVPQEAIAIMPGVTASPANPTDTCPAFAGVPVSYSGLPPPVDTHSSPMSSPMVSSSQPLLPATVDSFDAPLHNAVGNYGRLPVPTRAENELYNPPPFTAQQNQVSYELQQPGTGVPSASPYLQGCVALHHETFPRAEYVQSPAPFGFPGQLMGTVAPMFTPQHMTTGGTLQQFIPAGHMTMFPSNHVSMNPNPVQPMMPQQIRFEHYPVVNSVVQRVGHVPTDQGYNAYCTQVPAVGGEAYGWHKIPQTEHMVFSEGFPQHQQPTTLEKVSKFDDCFMCQKALPHAHSDSLALDNRESPVSTMPESQPTFHSLHLDVQGRPVDNILAGETVGDTISEQPGTVSQETQVLGWVNQNNCNTQPIVEGLANNAQGPFDKRSASFQKAENSDHPRLPLPQALIGITGGLQPHGVFVGNLPQSFHDNLIHPPVNPTQYQFKQDDTITKPSTGDTAGLGGMVSRTSEHLVDDAREDYSGNLSTTAAVEDNVKSYAAYDHIRQTNGRMENLQVNPYEAVVTTEQIKPTDNPQVINGEVYSDSVLNRPNTVLNGNEFNANEAVTSSSSQYMQPAQTYEMPQAPQFVDAGLVSHSKFGVNLVHDETSSNSAFANVDSAHTAQRTPPVGESKLNAAMNQPNIASSGAESVPSSDNISLLSPPHVVGDLQDDSNSLFSNQDFWNLHETHFPPPIPSKIQIKKEKSGVRHLSNDNSLGNGDFLTGNNMGFGTDMRLDQGSSHSAGSSEEQIKQQLQAVAEDVASSVLQSSLPSNPDLSGLDKSVSPSTSHQIGEAPTTDHDRDRLDASDSVNSQDLRARLPDKTNIGFPLSDGLGRLQIIKNSDLEELRELGSGTFGTVYHGKWRGTDVAIKRINDRCFAGKTSEQERMRDDFWNEAIKLADLHHPNVVAFYGVVLDGPGHSVATVTEYMTDGSLRSALQKSERNLDKRKRLLISMDVAFGMEYLHGKNIVHFDLKSDNLLVNLRDPHRPICKVGDLGLSKVKCHTLISGGVRGTLPWMAPELLNGSSSLVSEKVDVYSFGIVMWELLTREEPYADLHYGAIIGGIVSNTLRPPVPEGCDPEWSSLMEQCWSAEPSERPNFTAIANELRTMASKIPSKMQNQHAAASKRSS